MYIHEAIKQAQKNNACITLPEFKGDAKIKPTDGVEACIVINNDGSNPSKYGWQPTASQLSRDDWIVVD